MPQIKDEGHQMWAPKIQLQSDLRPQVIEALRKGPVRFQACYEKMCLTLPGYHPLHFNVEVMGWIQRSQVRVVYDQKQLPYLSLWSVDLPVSPQEEANIERQGKDIIQEA